VFCSSCGVAVPQGLTYCKNCGAKLTHPATANEPPEIRPGGLITMMVATFVMGTFVIGMLMGVMKVIVQFDMSLIVAFTILSFLTMLTLEGIFIKLLFSRKRGQPESSQQNNRAATKELEAESRLRVEPVASVTEHTTRAFDPVYGERK
jgi:predicted lipid-binding transport protein (Tim44 family)